MLAPIYIPLLDPLAPVPTLITLLPEPVVSKPVNVPLPFIARFVPSNLSLSPIENLPVLSA